MKCNLDRRLARLEKTTDGAREGRIFVVKGHDCRRANAYREAGIEPEEGDMVVFVRQFGDDWRDRAAVSHGAQSAGGSVARTARKDLLGRVRCQLTNGAVRAYRIFS